MLWVLKFRPTALAGAKYRYVLRTMSAGEREGEGGGIDDRVWPL